MWIACARRVRVVHPEQPAVGDHQIRVAIEREKRRELLYSLPYVAQEHDPAVRGDFVAQQDLIGPEPQGEHELPPERADLQPATAVVLIEHIVFAARVVELTCPRPDDNIVYANL